VHNPLWLPPSKWKIARAKKRPPANPHKINQRMVQLLTRAKLLALLAK
jgi:hypothetical protein